MREIVFVMHCSEAERMDLLISHQSSPQPKTWPPELSSLHSFLCCSPSACACQLAWCPSLYFCHTGSEAQTHIKRLLSELQALVFSWVLGDVRGRRSCAHPSTAQPA